MTPGPLDLDRLRVLAEAATEGPWAWESVGDKDNDWCLGVLCGEDDQPLSGRVEAASDAVADELVCSGNGLHNAAYIAAVSPDVLLALLFRLQASEARVRELERALACGMDEHHATVCAYCRPILDALPAPPAEEDRT